MDLESIQDSQQHQRHRPDFGHHDDENKDLLVRRRKDPVRGVGPSESSPEMTVPRFQNLKRFFVFVVCQQSKARTLESDGDVASLVSMLAMVELLCLIKIRQAMLGRYYSYNEQLLIIISAPFETGVISNS